MLYPYHLSDIMVKGLRITPFSYYTGIMEVSLQGIWIRGGMRLRVTGTLWMMTSSVAPSRGGRCFWTNSVERTVVYKVTVMRQVGVLSSVFTVEKYLFLFCVLEDVADPLCSCRLIIYVSTVCIKFIAFNTWLRLKMWLTELNIKLRSLMYLAIC